MGTSAQKDIGNSISFNILIKKEDDLFVAHCLELDIVAARETLEETEKEIIDLVCAQVDYAFSNDNLDNLYHPAPIEVWREFLACKESMTKRTRVKSAFSKRTAETIVPPWIIAHTCRAEELCHF